MAMPIDGTWEVVTAPMSSAIVEFLVRIEFCAKLLHRHVVLLLADMLHRNVVYGRQFEDIVDVATAADHPDPVPRHNRSRGLVIQPELAAIGLLVRSERGAIVGARQ